MKATSIVGRKENTKLDFYETPAWATQALLDRERFSESVWEPACGAGAMVEVLEDNGYEVFATDIQLGENFFTLGKRSRDIITNPPFNQAEKFVYHALEVGGNKVAMFLKLTFLESARRYKLFKETPLETVYVFSKRVNLYPFGKEKTKNSGTIAFAWFVWNKKYQGEPKLRWII